MNVERTGKPLVVALAGPNGAGKSTFYSTQLKDLGLRFVNADDIGRQLGLGVYQAAEAADRTRRELVRQRVSFVFETVFSDPVGDKVAFLKELEAKGYQVILCFIGISSVEISEQRVSIRVSKGGHDVPSDKLVGRYGRTLVNLALALRELGEVRVFDNDDLGEPYRLVARTLGGAVVDAVEKLPGWVRTVLPRT